ncbi:MAG: hypothetical protein N2234_10690 [Planctomycetota bacterium]|nr:hypothetical protein [Planctomycetota bacterium]
MRKALLIAVALSLTGSTSLAEEILSLEADYWWSDMSAELRTNSDVAGLGTHFTHDDLNWEPSQQSPVGRIGIATPFLSLRFEHFTLHYTGTVTLTSSVVIGDTTYLVSTQLDTRYRIASYCADILFSIVPFSKLYLGIGASIRVVDYHLFAHGTAATLPPQERTEEVRTQAPLLAPVAYARLQPFPYISFSASLAMFAYHSSDSNFVLHRYARFKFAVALHPLPFISIQAGFFSNALDFEDIDPKNGFHYIESSAGPFIAVVLAL